MYSRVRLWRTEAGTPHFASIRVRDEVAQSGNVVLKLAGNTATGSPEACTNYSVLPRVLRASVSYYPTTGYGAMQTSAVQANNQAGTGVYTDWQIEVWNYTYQVVPGVPYPVPGWVELDNFRLGR